MENIIIAAIKEKKILSFTYSGYPRIVEPHIYGTNEGARQLLGYQIRGSSSSGGALPEWRRFKIFAMQNLQILNEIFPGRRSYPSGKHSHWDEQILIVE
jgi:phosphoketolase